MLSSSLAGEQRKVGISSSSWLAVVAFRSFSPLCLQLFSPTVPE